MRKIRLPGPQDVGIDFLARIEGPLPSYLVLATAAVGGAFHVLFAVDVEGDNVRVITAYHPSPEEWEPDFSSRKGNV